LWTAPAISKDRQPETIWDLIHAFDVSFSHLLTAEELEMKKGKRPEEILDADPELYEKIRLNVKRWTDDWVREAVKRHKKISREKMDYALQSIVEIDAVLEPYFEARHWPYRTINAVFLPQALFVDPRARGSITLGLFLPFYPDVFFATVNPTVPTHMVLIHETIHFNQHGVWLGHPLNEGIADSIARKLAEENRMVTAGQLKRWAAYETERRVVDYLIDRIVERTDHDRDAALDILVGTSVTGDQSKVIEVLGAEAWEQVLLISRIGANTPWKLIKRALQEALPPVERKKG